jgi:D-arginine dehydrogenase
MRYDIIVIGAGIAGASIGYELAAHARVLLLEAESMPGVHATGRSAALLSRSYGSPAVRALTRAATPFFHRPPEEFAEQPLLLPRGLLFIGRADQRDQVERVAAVMRECGVSPERVTPEHARELVPLLRDGYVADAILDPQVSDVDVDVVYQGFLRGFRARGGALRTDVRVSQVRREDGAWRVAVGAEEAIAPILVNAAGAWADQVARVCGVPAIGLRTLRRTAILIDLPESAHVDRWPAVMDPDEQFYFKPDAGALLISPADEHPDEPGDVQAEELDVAIAVDRVQGALDIEVRRVKHSWAGLRTFAADRDPVLGFEGCAPDFFWCAGQGGTGVQTSPAMARLGAALITGNSPPPDFTACGVEVDALSPLRFR